MSLYNRASDDALNRQESAEAIVPQRLREGPNIE
jgi:hypothetical protein